MNFEDIIKLYVGTINGRIVGLNFDEHLIPTKPFYEKLNYNPYRTTKEEYMTGKIVRIKEET